MARIRTVKPEFYTDEAVMSVCPTARLMFIGLFNFADDRGVMQDSPLQIKARIFPGDAFEIDLVRAWLDDLATVELIQRYEVEGQKLFIIKNFLKHQRIDRPTPSNLPLPPFYEDSSSDQRGLDEDSTQEGKGKEGKGKEKDKPPKPPKGGKGVFFSEDFETFYKVYPKKLGGKEQAWKNWERRRKAGTLPPMDHLLLSLRKLIGWADWKKEDGKFIPYVTTFLNKGKWTDADNLPTPKIVDMGRRGEPGCEKCGGKGWWYDREGETGRQCACVKE